jgi:hypothetical protein
MKRFALAFIFSILFLRAVTFAGQPAGLQDFSASFGDSVTYAGTQTELYSCNGHDDTGVWTVYSEINGMPQGYSYYNSLWDSKQYHSLMEQCQGTNGTVEAVTTKAGTFMTCHVQTSANDIWYGNVPIFGAVKLVSKDGTYHTELVQYNLGTGTR